MEPKPIVELHAMDILLMNSNCFAIYFQQHSSYVCSDIALRAKVPMETALISPSFRLIHQDGTLTHHRLAPLSWFSFTDLYIGRMDS